MLEGARSSILTRASATTCCFALGWYAGGNLLKDGNWNSRTSSAKGSALKYNESGWMTGWTEAVQYKLNIWNYK